MTPEEAHHRAQRLFSYELLPKERTRDMDTIGWIETLLAGSPLRLSPAAEEPWFQGRRCPIACDRQRREHHHL
jgi:hypothetical protein